MALQSALNPSQTQEEIKLENTGACREPHLTQGVDPAASGPAPETTCPAQAESKPFYRLI